MTITAAEQYLLELINRARLNPVAEAARYNIDLNANLSPGQLGPESRQVLALNADLNDAAIKHSIWMLDADVFSHTGSGGSQPWTRATAEGYAWNAIGENIAFSGTTAATINLEAAISQHHQGLFLSAGHRVNILNDTYREIGIAQETGNYTQSGTTYRASMLTELFGLSGSKVFITGVAYDDTNADAFYSIGEGRSGISFASGSVQTTTAAAGGYQLAVTAGAAVAITGQVGSTSFAATLDASGGNVKLDIVNGATFHTSGSITLTSGIAGVQLLGLDAINANGNAASNTLSGNAGANRLEGFGGNDRLYGGNGSDRIYGGDGNDLMRGGNQRDFLYGGAGNDRLYGDGGNDVLNGGAGADSFYFMSKTGGDVIQDFDAATGDRIYIDDAILGANAAAARASATVIAAVVGSNVVLDLGGGYSITLSGITDVGGLDQYVIIF